MKDLNDLRRDRKAAADNMMQTLAAVETLEAAMPAAGAPEADIKAHGDKLAEAQTAHDAAVAAHKTADAAVKRREEAEAAAAAGATSEAEGTAPTAGQRPSGTAPAAATDPDDKGIEVGAMVHALANAKGDRDRAAQSLEQNGYSRIGAALSGATDAAGGVTIPRPQAQEFIALLRPMVTVMASGAREIDMPAGQVRAAKQATAATAGYGAENFATVESEPTFTSIDQSFKTLRSLVPVGNALLRHSSPYVFGVVRDDILRVMGLRKDLAFLRGDGSANTPTGIRSWAVAGHTQTAIANGVAVVDAALRRMVSDVEDADVQVLRGGWIMRASTKNFLASLREPNGGQKMYPSIEDKGELLGYPIRTTSQVPNNLGVGTNESEVYFADFARIMVGSSMQLAFATSDAAAFVDTGGDTISAFQRDLTLMRAIEEHDLAPEHDVAISYLTGAAWSL